jgi:hypothetical protein
MKKRISVLAIASVLGLHSSIVYAENSLPQYSGVSEDSGVEVSKVVDMPTPNFKDKKEDKLGNVSDKTKTEPSVEASTLPVAKKDVKRSILSAENGVLQIIYISKGHLNRFELPFENPIVTTAASDKQLARKKNKNIIFFGTNATKPITVFISPSNRSDVSLPLVLVPQQIEPVDVKVNIKGYKQVEKPKQHLLTKNVSKMARLEVKGESDYEDMLVGMAVNLAQGKVPDGYSMEDIKNDKKIKNTCSQDGLSFDLFQIGRGVTQDIVVYKVSNETKQLVEFNEKSCANGLTRLVSSYPQVTVQAGGAIEAYVIQSHESAIQNNERKRAF